MKTIYISICVYLMFCVFMPELYAQNNENGFVTYSGIVKDATSGRRIENATVFIPDSHIGTVTNSEGEFRLKVPKANTVRQLKITHIGYYNLLLTVNGGNLSDLVISLVGQVRALPEVNIIGGDARDLIDQVIKNIPMNYSMIDNQMLGFYRETVQKRRKYINISEAVIDTYKSSYKYDADRDRVRIVKGRKIVTQNKKDTLGVKLLGGPTISIYMDIVKNPFLLFDKQQIEYYKFHYKNIVTIGERLNYEIEFIPTHILPYALHKGKLYIDVDNLGVTRAEFEMDMSDKNKVTKEILKKKPFGLRFKPEELTYVISYAYRDSLYYFNYARNEMRFKCDWKRRLFATNYTIVSEMVTTDIKDEEVNKIPRKEAFRVNQVFSDQVTSFVDPNFWESYNIIEPTESLESGVKKLRKQQE